MTCNTKNKSFLKKIENCHSDVEIKRFFFYLSVAFISLRVSYQETSQKMQRRILLF